MLKTKAHFYTMENSKDLVSPFQQIRIEASKALTPSEMVKMYIETKSQSVVSEYWSFDDDALQTEFVKNENIVKETEAKLAVANEKDQPQLLEKLRTYKRFLKFLSFGVSSFLDQKTGELKEGAVANFEDIYNKKLVQMGQAKLVGRLQEIEKMIRQNGATLSGVVFIVEYTGRTKNKKNDQRSDNFNISIIQ